MYTTYSKRVGCFDLSSLSFFCSIMLDHFRLRKSERRAARKRNPIVALCFHVCPIYIVYHLSFLKQML